MVMTQDRIVFIVDDDPRIRESVCELLSSYDVQAVAFASAADYLAYPRPDIPACLVLDVQLPDINGLDLQNLIAQDNHPFAVIDNFGNETYFYAAGTRLVRGTPTTMTLL